MPTTPGPTATPGPGPTTPGPTATPGPTPTAEADGTQPAGDFTSWLDGMEKALRREADSDVPCGTCTACCRSSQFIHIAPDETQTLASIPAALLFPAPGLPEGHVLMGYDEHGCCPMLVEDACSIYSTRPATCRTYDCRVFAAAVITDPDPAKADITRRAAAWRFSYGSREAELEQEAVARAAAFLGSPDEPVAREIAPPNATQRAVLALAIHDCFLERDAQGAPTGLIDPDPDVVRDEVVRRSAQ